MVLILGILGLIQSQFLLFYCVCLYDVCMYVYEHVIMCLV